MPASQHRIFEADIVAPEIYAREREARRRALIPIKRNRRIEVGPYATFYFENYDTMLAQVHEMLHIEKGGREQIAGVEESVYLSVGSERIEAQPTEYEDRTTEDGKTSSVHWVRFAFTDKQIAGFKNPAVSVILGLTHPNYGHMAVVSPDVRAELAKDFN